MIAVLRVTILLQLALAVSALWGQQDAAAVATEELEKAELDFIKELVTTSMPTIKQQALNLLSLEQKAVAQRDYGAAQQMRLRRQELEWELLRLDRQLQWLGTREESLRAKLLPERIELPLGAAQLKGPRLVGGELTGWSQSGASATWKLPNLPTGGYELLARLRCGALEGGIIEAREAKFFMRAQISTTSQGPQEQVLGILKISNGRGELSLTANSILKDNLFNLIGLWLIPSSQHPPLSPSSKNLGTNPAAAIAPPKAQGGGEPADNSNPASNSPPPP